MKKTYFLAAVFLFAIVTGFAGNTERLKKADDLYRAGKWDLTIQVYDSLLPKLSGEKKAEALIRVGYCWQRKFKHDVAITYFEQAIPLKGATVSQIAVARLRLSYSLRLQGKHKEAFPILAKIYENMDVPANTRAEALLYTGWSQNTLGNKEQAVSIFHRIADLKDVHANYIASGNLSIGRILQEQGKYKEAVAVYRDIFRLKPVASTNLARARVYRLECEALLAGDLPFHIKPYVTRVDSESAHLCWVSQHVNSGKDKSKKSAKVMIVKASHPVKIPEIITEPIRDTVCRLHTAKWSGLKPGTTYHYEVHFEGKKQTGSFKTAPAKGSPFSFCLIGDTQSYHRGLQPMLDRMGKEQTDFVLHVGDITDRGNLWGEWKAGFFDPGHNYLQSMVLWPVYGNHDGGPYFPQLFGLRKNYWYSFDWGDAHFVILDSYGAGSGGIGRKRQLEWLKKDLEANTKRWTFVALHVPMIATRAGISKFGQEDFLPLLEKHQVDVVFSGHHPHYRRYRPVGLTGNRPILHVTSGGGGGPVGGNMPSPLLREGVDINHYCVITVDGDRLSLTARALNGVVIDRFEMVRQEVTTNDKLGKPVPFELGKKVISLYQELLTDRTYVLNLEVDNGAKPGEKTTLHLDLSRLPRGPLDTKTLPANAKLLVQSTTTSPWKIEPQSFSLKDGKGTFFATAPKQLSIVNKVYRPQAEVQLQLQIGNQSFEPYTAKTRILVTKSAE